MSTITIETTQEPVADYQYVRTKIIRDKERQKKRGLSGYEIVAHMWHGKWEYYAYLDCSWFLDTCKSCDSLREASDYIKKYVYP